MKPSLLLACTAVVVAAASAGGGGAGGEGGGEERSQAATPLPHRAPAGPYPPRSRLRDAKRYASGRPGSVSFAVIGPGGRVRGQGAGRVYSSASVTKAMLLAAYLRSHRRLTGAARSQLRSMVVLSDNRAADAVYASVGDEGLSRVARGAGMRHFRPTPGFWGGAQITAADIARFFFRLERNLGARHRGYGLELLAGIVSYERWGIPEGAGHGWSVWFKGGWRPGGGEHSSGPVSHQAALLRYRDGTRVALAVLTDEVPGPGGGYSTIEGIARRLLNPHPASAASTG